MDLTYLNNKVTIGFFPTPLHKLQNLSRKFPDYEIFIKRDDQTGLASGGNKTRKLEYLLWEALQGGCDTILTSGAQQSNHCRQTAAACAMYDMECHLLLGGFEPDRFNGNLLLSELCGANIHFTKEERKGESLGKLDKKLTAAGKKCFVVPYGGSNITGVLGFVNAMKELKNQLITSGDKFDYIFFASSSGGTQAGLHLGKELFDIESKLMPINIDKDDGGVEGLRDKVFNLLQMGKTLFELDKEFELDDINVVGGYDNAGYGTLTDAEKSAIQKLAALEGILVDPVYTGRAFYGMLDILYQKTIPKGAKILFWHTGGFPAVFKYEKELKQN